MTTTMAILLNTIYTCYTVPGTGDSTLTYRAVSWRKFSQDHENRTLGSVRVPWKLRKKKFPAWTGRMKKLTNVSLKARHFILSQNILPSTFPYKDFVGMYDYIDQSLAMLVNSFYTCYTVPGVGVTKTVRNGICSKTRIRITKIVVSRLDASRNIPQRENKKKFPAWTGRMKKLTNVSLKARHFILSQNILPSTFPYKDFVGMYDYIDQ